MTRPACSLGRAFAAAALALAAASCAPGGATPEETLEKFNGHMAAKDFARAAAAVYRDDWRGLSAAALAASRDAYAGELAREYEHAGLDYGRGEILERRKTAEGAVAFVVEYRFRDRPSSSAKRVMPFTKVDGVWYYSAAGRPE